MQEQGPAREALTTPLGPATAPIQVTHNTPREGSKEDPGTPDIGIEEEEQPPGVPAQEQGNEETCGDSTGEVLKGLCRKLEEEKNQEDSRTIKLLKKIREREKSFEEGTGGLDRPTYLELLHGMRATARRERG